MIYCEGNKKQIKNYSGGIDGPYGYPRLLTLYHQMVHEKLMAQGLCIILFMYRTRLKKSLNEKLTYGLKLRCLTEVLPDIRRAHLS